MRHARKAPQQAVGVERQSGTGRVAPISPGAHPEEGPGDYEIRKDLPLDLPAALSRREGSAAIRERLLQVSRELVLVGSVKIHVAKRAPVMLRVAQAFGSIQQRDCGGWPRILVHAEMGH